MSHRFFVDDAIDGDVVTLTGAEAKHISGVMRLHAGDSIVLFDDSGDEFPAEIMRIERDSVECSVLGRHQVDREQPRLVTLYVALPKGDRQRWLVEKSVELGVTKLVPLMTLRGVAQPTDKTLVRMRRAVIEASKQCGRNRLMTIAEPRNLQQVDVNDDGRFLLGHPDGAHVSESQVCGRNLAFAIGPEGGFTADEVAAAVAAGWCPVSLGSRILRVETAAVAAAAWISTQPSPD